MTLRATSRCRVRGSRHKSFATFDGDQEFVLERAIISDFSLARTWRVDRHGNLVYRYSAQNFNPLAAMCGRNTIAEVEELLEPGELDPDQVHTPGVFVQPVAPPTAEQAADKIIEKRMVRPGIAQAAAKVLFPEPNPPTLAGR